MGRRRIASIAPLAVCAVILAAGAAQADPGSSLFGFLDDPILLAPAPHPISSSRLLSVGQDVITEAEYDRLTGVRKRVGVSVFGVMGFMGGPDAGKLRLNYSDLQTTQVDYADLFNVEGTGFGAEVSLIVAPAYSVHMGAGLLYHKGKPYGNNDWSDLYRYPFYLGIRLCAPLALSFSRWLDFENPEYVTGLIPFFKLKIQGTYWREVEISGSSLPYYENSRDYFVEGFYPELFAGGGVEFRVGPFAVFGEAGINFQLIAPRLSKYFEMDPTEQDEIVPSVPFEFVFQGGVTYYFGSGRIFTIMPDAD